MTIIPLTVPGPLPEAHRCPTTLCPPNHNTQSRDTRANLPGSRNRFGHDVAMARRKRPGGPRRRETFHLPEALLDAITVEAARRGIPKLDLVGQTLARELGLPYELSTSHEGQEELPLKTAS